jgi:hypothetical protein
VADNPDADSEEDVLPGDLFVTSTGCQGNNIAIINNVRPYGKKVCIDTVLTYEGDGVCTAFHVNVAMNRNGASVTSMKSSRTTVYTDSISGDVMLKSPIWFKGMACGEAHRTQTCFYTSGTIDNPVDSMSAVCTSHEEMPDPVSGDEVDEL